MAPVCEATRRARYADDAALIAVLGPDAARLLADAMDALTNDSCKHEWDSGRLPCDYGDGPIETWCVRCNMLARFAALGEDTP
jgi:hypothetical protein